MLFVCLLMLSTSLPFSSFKRAFTLAMASSTSVSLSIALLSESELFRSLSVINFCDFFTAVLSSNLGSSFTVTTVLSFTSPSAITILYFPGKTFAPPGSGAFSFGFALPIWRRPFSSIFQILRLKPLSTFHFKFLINESFSS